MSANFVILYPASIYLFLVHVCFFFVFGLLARKLKSLIPKQFILDIKTFVYYNFDDKGASDMFNLKKKITFAIKSKAPTWSAVTCFHLLFFYCICTLIMLFA